MITAAFISLVVLIWTFKVTENRAIDEDWVSYFGLTSAACFIGLTIWSINHYIPTIPM